MNAKELGKQSACMTDLLTNGMSGYMVRGGLTKRELFAAMALQGIVSSGDVYAAMSQAADKRGVDITVIAGEAATDFADGLLNKLVKDQQP